MHDLSAVLYKAYCNVVTILTRYEFVIGHHVSTTEELPVIKYYITKICCTTLVLFSNVCSR